MAALSKRKQVEETTQEQLTRARAHLAEINGKIAALDRDRDAKLLEDDATGVDRIENEQRRLQHDAGRVNRRIELLAGKMQEELQDKQRDAREALIGRVEGKYQDFIEHVDKMCGHLADAVKEMQLARSANSAVAAAWPFAPTDSEACLFGKFFRVAIRHELYRLSAKPYLTVENRGDFDFPGAESPSPFLSTDPSRVKPLQERVREAAGYASRIMRESKMPLLVLAPAQETPALPVPNQPAPIAPAAEAKNEPEQILVRKEAKLEYAFYVDFINHKTDAERTEEVIFGEAEIAEANLDGLGATGPRGREIALRVAEARVPSGFVLADKPNAIKFDLARLMKSINGE